MPSALYFTSHQKIASLQYYSFNLFRVTRLDGGLGTVQALYELDTDSESERAPVLTPDERQIYFARTNKTLGGRYEISTASRATSADAFSDVHVVSELSVGSIQHPTDQPDGCVLYLMRDYDLYVARKKAQ